MTAAITILGLGPGKWSDLTLQVYTLLTQAAAANQTVYFRTTIHPTIDRLKIELPALPIESFDRLYDESNDWQTLYQRIAEELCTLATQAPILYAVPGHPLIGESTVQRVLSLSRERGLSTTIVAGLSFLEPVCAALELDPLEVGTQIIDATALATLNTDEIAGKIIPTLPLLVAQVYNSRIASAVKLALSELYSDEWLVKLVTAVGASTANDTVDNGSSTTPNNGETSETVVTMPLYELDRNRLTNHLSTLYIPPLAELTALRLPETLRYITMRLRRDPDGCPWDRQQTHQSLTRYVIEETYEVVEALEENDMDKLAEELGDLLLQVYLHAEIASQQGDFAIGDVFEHVNAKLIRRHPHVFGTVEVSGTGQVVQNWDAIKQQEKIAAGRDVHTESVLDSVPLASPALMLAQEYQKRAAKLGFEFDNITDLLKKIYEEIQEVQAAATPAQQFDEMGDILFIVAKAARWLKIDAEEALRHANRTFRQRFQAMEELIRHAGRSASSYSSEEWLELWRRVKN
ncbi:MAG: nucleoside triphosphate pyrophosphohydrolase [Ktedonobacteraceae bacterium]